MNPALLQSDTQRLIDFQKQQREQQKNMKDRTAHQNEEHRRTMHELQEKHKDQIQESEQLPKDSTQCHDDKKKQREQLEKLAAEEAFSVVNSIPLYPDIHANSDKIIESQISQSSLVSANSVGLKVTKRCPDSTQKCVAYE